MPGPYREAVTRLDARLQASGRRFVARRMERALEYGDADAPHTPSVSFALGVVLAVLGVVGCVVLSLVRPSADAGNAPMLMDRGTGALYVRVDGVVHPVLNLTSARLIARSGERPRPVDGSALTRFARGALLGIPGAPFAVGAPLEQSEWTACDGARTTVIAGKLHETTGVQRLSASEPVLVAGPAGTAYLIYDGRRAALDPADPAVSRALRLDGITPRPVSATFLNLLPEAAPIVTPRIAGAGRPGPDALPGFAVGDVVRVRRADTDEYHVVLDGGVQRIGMVAADLIRFGSGASTDIPALAAAAVAAVPTLGALPVSSYPDRLAPPAHQHDNTICATAAGDTVTVYAGAGPLPAGEQRPAVLAQADGAGPAVDEVFVPPGRSLYVRPAGVGPPLGSVVADTGVRFPVGDTESARILGLPDAAAPAPWAVLAALPVGPVLSRAAALTAYDVVPGAAPPAGQG